MKHAVVEISILLGLLTMGCSIDNDEPEISQNTYAIEVCNDGVDGDLDTLIDCIDPECANDAACVAAGVIPCEKDFYWTNNASNIGEMLKLTQDLSDPLNPEMILSAVGDTDQNINATCYNITDGFMYGIRITDDHLVRIKKVAGAPPIIFDMTSIEDLGVVTGLGAEQFNAGDCDDKDNLWVKNADLMNTYVISGLSQLVAGVDTPVATTVSTGLRGADIAFDGDTERFYSAGSFANVNTIYTYDVLTGMTTSQSINNALEVNTNGHGAQYFDSDGYLYAYHNGTGSIRRINVASGDAVWVGQVSTGGGDGMSCSRAAPPLEYCGNGVDDDGDGFIDENDGTPTGNNCINLDDTDGDLIPDVLDLDDDNDGIPDGRELGDTDGDGISDRKDLDSDNDGIHDVDEALHDGIDANHDGILDGAPAAFGVNGLHDDLETFPDTAQLDYNSDMMTGDAPANTDGNGPPDFQDLDSDDDGVPDVSEAGLVLATVDTNDDGVVDLGADADNDGIQDLVDAVVAGRGDDDSATPLPDADNDGNDDYREIDSDGDGTFDIAANSPYGAEDGDNDGVIDATADADNDGILDVIDDSNEDGVADSVDGVQGFGGLVDVPCGNSVLDGGETCDDGGNGSGDGCSATCQVESGYTCPTPGTACSDINECAMAADNNCSANATCTNTAGSFTCACNMGFTGDGVTCTATAVDECAMGTDNCSDDALCMDTAAAFTCTCNAGFTGDGVTCDDDDECAVAADNNCSADATCTNTAGSFTCACNDGFTGDGVTCTATAVDECAMGTDNCSDDALCTDTAASFTCECNDGFTGDGVTCTVIEADDECALGTDDCSDDATCTNTDDSFTCECNAGFTGDGVTCTANVEPTGDLTLEGGGCSTSSSSGLGGALFAMLAFGFLGRTRRRESFVE